MVILGVMVIIILIYGFVEQIKHLRRIKQIPIRIHVNGTRGKSTTTRLIAGGLREAGFKVLAKTTGTLPRLILEDGTEIPLKRRGNPNISEQLRIFKEAAKRKVDAVVLECMAVNPELQWVSEHKMVKSTIGVITNVREDHLEDIGPGLAPMAEALKLTIPQGGILVTAEKDYFPVFREQAAKLKTKIILAEPNTVSDRVMEKFNYLNFKENVSLALQVNKLLGVEEEVALKGMLQAQPDPGALKIYKLPKNGKTLFFINAFAANDKSSTLLIWENLRKRTDLNLDYLPTVGIINSRDDRVLRDLQFAKLLAEEIKLSKIILVGQLSKLVERALLKLKVSPDKILNLEKIGEVEKILSVVLTYIDNDQGVFIGFGNTKGMGQKLIDYFNQWGETK